MLAILFSLRSFSCYWTSLIVLFVSFFFLGTFGTLITARENCFVFNITSRWTDIHIRCCFMMAPLFYAWQKSRIYVSMYRLSFLMSLEAQRFLFNNCFSHMECSVLSEQNPITFGHSFEIVEQNTKNQKLKKIK